MNIDQFGTGWTQAITNGVQLDLGNNTTAYAGTNPKTGQLQVGYQTGAASQAYQAASGVPGQITPLLNNRAFLVVGVLIVGLALFGLARRM